MFQKKTVQENSNKELTIEKLRSYTGFESFSDQQAQIAILNIKRLAKILFSIYQNDNTSENPIK
jgi:hypothetical protein